MISKAREIDIEKLVEDIPLVSLDVPVSKIAPTKKRIRRLVLPHLRAHQVKGKLYYSYCRGDDREIYLGTADAILKVIRRRNANCHAKKEGHDKL